MSPNTEQLILSELAGIRKLQEEHGTLMSAIKTTTDKLEKTVEGNGRKGLRERVEILERAEAGEEKVKRDKQARRMNVVTLVASLAAVAGMIYHIVHMAR